jgi:sugar phosphate isomerase/epimerase
MKDHNFFISTTFHGINNTNFEEVVDLIKYLNYAGIEFGSTHQYSEKFKQIINKKIHNKRIITHNFFPTSKNNLLVVNLASTDNNIRQESINHALHCIKFAAEIGAEMYTIHPGFLTEVKTSSKNSHNYDFEFNQKKVQYDDAFNRLCSSLNILSNFAEQHNIILAIESEGSLTSPDVSLMEKLDEFDNLFSKNSNKIMINLNLAHSYFAAKYHNYNLKDFILKYKDRISAVEISHNDGFSDQHFPLVKDSYIFDYLKYLPDVPHILEFRNTKIDQLEHSLDLLRNYSS